MLSLVLLPRSRVAVEDQSSKDLLKKGYFGSEAEGALNLSVEEALYLIDARNASLMRNGAEVAFNELAAKFWNKKKFIARYFTYKDWRDRGLVVEPPSFEHREPNKTPLKKYPASSISLPKHKLTGVFFKNDLMSILDDQERGMELYERFWLGQYGTYKAAERGKLNKLDVYETLYLLDSGIIELKNATRKGVVAYATARRKDFPRLYEVYKDLRDRGYVIKTGFKFGTHFRLYFPGARPMKKEDSDWTHSKHVIQVFPKESKLLISEWARAIRVAHSVRKTFILAVPGTATAKKIELDFILYHRKGGDAENPDNAAPRFAMLSLSEEEYIGGAELAGAISEAKRNRLELIVAIADRETAVTYYKVRQIELPHSEHEYYEIDWMQP